MHWLKKAVFGGMFTLFIFVIISVLSSGGIDLFADSFLGFGGLVLLLAMGVIEINLVTYS